MGLDRMRMIDRVIFAIKVDPDIAPYEKIWLLQVIAKRPETSVIQRLMFKHKFNSDIYNETKCICGETWNVPIHQFTPIIAETSTPSK